MKMKTSLMTFLVFVLIAGSAFAAPTEVLDMRTGFEPETDWNPVAGGPGAVGMDLRFYGDWSYGSSSIIGSYEQYTPTIVFGRGEVPTGATRFWFSYNLFDTDVTLTVTLDNSIGSLTDDQVASFFGADGTSSTALGRTDTTLTFLLTDSGHPVLEDDFYFYISDGVADAFAVKSISFMNGSGEIIELTALDYDPSAVPIPGAAWLLGSGLVGLVGLRRRFKA